VDAQQVGFAADLAIFHVFLATARALIHGRIVPLTTPGALVSRSHRIEITPTDDRLLAPQDPPHFCADAIACGIQEHTMGTSYTAAQHGFDHRLVTTAFEIDGYRVIRNLGIVRGITVRSRSIFGTLGASLQTLVGGNITLLTNLCEKTRAEAFELMVRHAAELGANAVIGVRYDATEVMQGVTEVLAYGTAVVMEPVRA